MNTRAKDEPQNDQIRTAQVNKLYYAGLLGAIVEARYETKLTLINGEYGLHPSFIILSPPEVVSDHPSFDGGYFYEIEDKLGPPRKVISEEVYNIFEMFIKSTPHLSRRIFVLNHALNNSQILLNWFDGESLVALRQYSCDITLELHKNHSSKIKNNLTEVLNILQNKIFSRLPSLENICFEYIRKNGIFSYDTNDIKNNLNNLPKELRPK